MFWEKCDEGIWGRKKPEGREKTHKVKANMHRIRGSLFQSLHNPNYYRENSKSQNDMPRQEI